VVHQVHHLRIIRFFWNFRFIRFRDLVVHQVHQDLRDHQVLQDHQVLLELQDLVRFIRFFWIFGIRVRFFWNFRIIRFIRIFRIIRFFWIFGIIRFFWNKRI
jgi:hypothetical protein